MTSHTPEPSGIMLPHPPAENSSLMRIINSLNNVMNRIERNRMFFQGQNSTKVQIPVFPGDSTLLGGTALTSCGGIIFERIHCVFGVLNVEKVGGFEFELSAKSACATSVRTALMIMAVPTQVALFECGTAA